MNTISGYRRRFKDCREHGRVPAYRIRQKWTDCKDRPRVRIVYSCSICRKLDARVDAWKHHARRLAYAAAWRERNRERLRAYQREYRRTRPEDVRITMKLTRAKNREARLAKRRAEYAAQRQEAA